MNLSNKIWTWLFICSSLFVVNELEGQELTFFQGAFSQQFYEDDQRITRREFINKISSVPESADHWRRYKTNNTIATVSSLGTGVALYFWISRDDGESTTVPAVTTIGGLLITTIFAQKALDHQRDAILAYNQNKAGAYHVMPSKEGIGLTINF